MFKRWEVDSTKQLSLEIHLLQLSNLETPLNIMQMFCFRPSDSPCSQGKYHCYKLMVVWPASPARIRKFARAMPEPEQNSSFLCDVVKRPDVKQGKKSIMDEVEISLNFIHFFKLFVSIRFLYIVGALLKKKPSL